MTATRNSVILLDMANQGKQLPVDPKDMKEITIPPELKGGVYANTINVTATNSEVVINFINLNPTDEPKGTLVSRVVIPSVLAEKLSQILQDVKRQLEEKEKMEK